MEVIAVIVITVVTVLFGLMAVVPLVFDSVSVRPRRPVPMSVVMHEDDREQVRAA